MNYKSENFKIDGKIMDEGTSVYFDTKISNSLKSKLFNGLVKGLEREGVVLHDEPLRAEGKVKIKI